MAVTRHAKKKGSTYLDRWTYRQHNGLIEI